ncbi:MAG TPA: glycosyltransferase family 87 protein [Candidatus Limnocylindrales bacterium]|nr:glycosyltransferase family 87 protein [Candidatus Limnocylindrales bacterium]
MIGSARVTGALLAFDDAGERLFAAVRRAAAARLPTLARCETSTWIGVAVALIGWGLVVAFSEPWGRLWGTGQDARCYYQATLANPYLHSDWNDPIAYVYSPAFLQLVSPLTALPWQAFMAVWTAILIGAVRLLTGPRLLAAGLLFPFTAMEVAGGNVSLLLAAAIVVGFRWPWTWSLVLLTKITPGIGLLWFAVRREWRSLAIALGATAAIALVSFVVLPDQWRAWVDVVARNVAAGKNGTWASVPVPLLVRLPLSVLLVVWGARTNRPSTVPVASMLALPALWYGGLSMLLAVIPLVNGSRWAPAGRSGDVRGPQGTVGG